MADMVNGKCCMFCGGYFFEAANTNKPYTHKQAVVCNKCWDEMTAIEKENHIKQNQNSIIIN